MRGCDNHILTSEEHVHLTTLNRSLMVCSVWVPCLPGVVHRRPDPSRAKLYPRVSIVEADNLGHPDGPRGEFRETWDEEDGFKIEERSRVRSCETQ